MKFPCSRRFVDRSEEDNQGLIFIYVYKTLKNILLHIE